MNATETKAALYTAHVTGHAHCWTPIVKCAGKVVWQGESRPTRDNLEDSARPLARLVCCALNTPSLFHERLRWASAQNQCGRRAYPLYKWAQQVAASIFAAAGGVA